MTLQTRNDGTQYPSSEADDAVLAEENTSDVRTDCGYSYHRTIGNLIIDVLGGYDLCESSDSDPQNWQTLENAMLFNAALEVKAIAVAYEYEHDGESVADEFTHNELSHLLRNVARRLEAGQELSKRLRRARWGHPGFGGGEGWDARQKAEKAARDLEALKQAAEAKAGAS